MAELIKILSKFKSKGVVVSVDALGENLSVKGNLKGLTDEDKRELVQHKDELISFFNQQRASKVVIPKVAESSEGYELSVNQESLWILGQFEEGNMAYNMPASRTLIGTYDIEAFREAILAVIRRHEILRTKFRVVSGEVRQFVSSIEELNFKLNTLDFSDENDPAKVAKEYINSDSHTPFDLEDGPLLRASLIQVGEEEFIFYYNMHHIISDGWSMDVLLKDVTENYMSLVQGQEMTRSDLRIQYKDYAAWQLSQLSDESITKHEAYWVDLFSDGIPRINLPSNKKRPELKTYNGRVLSMYLSEDKFDSIKTFSQENGGSVFNTLFAACNVLFSIYTGQKEIVLGTPVSGREHFELQDQIGFYVNTLALKSTIDRSTTFVDCYNELKQNTLASFSHQMYPFEKLVQALDVKRDKSRSAIFDILFSHTSAENAMDLFNEEAIELEKVVTKGDTPSKFDLDINFQEGKSHLYFEVIFNQDVYSQETVEGLMHNFDRLVTQLVRKSTVPMSNLEFLSSEEQNEQLNSFNDTKSDYPKSNNVVDLFEKQVEETPNEIGLTFETNTLTYDELNKRANQLASFLKKECEIRKGDVVGISLYRSEWTIISVLAVLKAGGAYVPLDPDYPKEHTAFIEKDVDLKFSITEDNLNEIKQKCTDHTTSNLETERSSFDLTYIMYTSGSTGRPKGVKVHDQAVVRLVKNTNYVSLDTSSVLLSTGAFPFDATTFEYWGMLLNGGHLILCPKRTLLNSASLEKVIRENKVSMMWMTSGWFSQVVEERSDLFSTLETVLVGGDVLSVEKIQTVYEKFPGIRLINGYGPTENTTFSLTHEIKRVNGSIPIGKPINNSTCYILDEYRQLIPKGVVGEIYVGGDGLATGYLNRPELSKEVFIENPFVPGEKLYKTGDMGRWNSEGQVEFLGRKDHQIKIRGYRIELGEIESVINAQEGVTSATVVTRSIDIAEKELICYIVGAQELNMSELRASLRSSLLPHMIPNYFIQIDQIPLTNNGKIDREKLPEPQVENNFSKAEYVAPSNDVEESIAGIWEEILGLKRVSVKADFFDLGGHSLKAMRITTKLREMYGVKIDLESMFNDPTIETLAKNVSTLLWLKEDSIESEGDEEFII